MISSTGPIVLGILRDSTGNYQTSLWLLVVLSVTLLLVSLALTPARLLRGVRPPEREALAVP
jgi:cyanate permease